LIVKALKIVSFALVLTTLSIAVAAGYSGYQEYEALSGLAQSQTGQLNFGIVGNNLTISGINIPNNMSFPLSVQLLGIAALQGAEIGSFDSGAHILQPGQVMPLLIILGLNFSKALSQAGVFRTAMLNDSVFEINASIDATVYPIIGLNITKSI